uniref:polysaccharide biosynthesis protein n=1 Tax=Ningiella ruwaisensis TaxID=2364274 RepID=UPI0010A059A8|nr:nucleoside-diphosphate sugar epimerase/dehydratase [Ningiella ruwaisensis]
MNLTKRLFLLSSFKKLCLSLLWDSFAIITSLLLSYVIRLGVEGLDFKKEQWWLSLLVAGFIIGILWLDGYYRQVVRHIGHRETYKVSAILLAASLFLLIVNLIELAFIPASVPFIFWGLAFLSLTVPRYLLQLRLQSQSYRNREKCIIFGAAETGRALALGLLEGRDLVPVAFIDDKSQYHKQEIAGIPVKKREDIPHIIESHGVTKLLFAVNNSSIERRKQLLSALEPYAIEILSVPNIADILSGKHKVDELHEIKIDELLGREPVPPIVELLEKNIFEKNVLVSGAGGSIGSELCRQIARGKPNKLILFEVSEYNLYSIENELKNNFPDLQIVPVLSTILDIYTLHDTIKQHKVQTIYHAAAYKHVPMIEANPIIGIRNNAFGTANIAQVASECAVEKFVLISTDKAVRPTNIMGATKRLAELYIQGIAELSPKTEYAIVRFGNVLGSSGSVVPLFKSQIERGGPITVTHPNITRYFMTIPEAAQLVIQAGAMGKQGEVFVLDMGEPVKIIDLALKMAHLMGRTIISDTNPDGDIEIVFSGLRPGEKLYEELLLNDCDVKTQHPRIVAADETKIPFDDVLSLLAEMNILLLENNIERSIELLKEAPLAYAPSIHVRSAIKNSDIHEIADINNDPVQSNGVKVA